MDKTYQKRMQIEDTFKTNKATLTFEGIHYINRCAANWINVPFVNKSIASKITKENTTYLFTSYHSFSFKRDLANNKKQELINKIIEVAKTIPGYIASEIKEKQVIKHFGPYYWSGTEDTGRDAVEIECYYE